MEAKFAELLDPSRLRLLWRKEPSSPAAGTPAQLAEPASPCVDGAPALPPPGRAALERDGLDPKSAPLQPLPSETPLEMLDKLERLLDLALGQQASLLGIYVQPLRLALARLAGAPLPQHPLQQAMSTDNLPLLIHQLEDSIGALLRLQHKGTR